MSIYKVDGHVFSVDEFHAWTTGFVALCRKGRFKDKKPPQEVREILKEQDDKLAAKAMMAYLKANDSYMPVLIKFVQEGAAELAMEKEKM